MSGDGTCKEYCVIIRYIGDKFLQHLFFRPIRCQKHADLYNRRLINQYDMIIMQV